MLLITVYTQCLKPSYSAFCPCVLMFLLSYFIRNCFFFFFFNEKHCCADAMAAENMSLSPRSAQFFSRALQHSFLLFFLSFICTGNTQQQHAGRVLLLLKWAFVKKVIMNPASHETASKHHIMNKSTLLLVEFFFSSHFFCTNSWI